jgi:hypothetical protein
LLTVWDLSLVSMIGFMHWLEHLPLLIIYHRVNIFVNNLLQLVTL